MSDSLPYLDILLLGVLAVFLILRLRSVLGQRTGQEKPPQWGNSDKDSTSNSKSTRDKVVDFEQVRKQNSQKTSENLSAETQDTRIFTGSGAEGLTKIGAQDSNFRQEEFLQGATAAFEMILGAYGAGDKKTLRDLLDDSVYQPFASTIDRREAENQTQDISLVSLQPPTILQARLDGGMALIEVRFKSQQIMVLKDKNGQILNGNPEQVQTMVDDWSFQRDLSSRDLNWILIATNSPDLSI